MATTDFDALAQRLDRIEKSLNRFNILTDLLNTADPPPDDLGRGHALLQELFDRARRGPIGDPAVTKLVRNLARRRPIADPAVLDLVRNLARRPPIGDPATSDTGRPASSVEDRLSELLARNPGWFANPPP